MDLPKSVVVHVKANHIKQGIVADCGHCPLALAINEVIPDCHAAVGTVDVDLYPKNGRAYLDVILPPKAVKFVRLFDDGVEGLRPFSFTLNLS